MKFAKPLGVRTVSVIGGVSKVLHDFLSGKDRTLTVQFITECKILGLGLNYCNLRIHLSGTFGASVFRHLIFAFWGISV